MLKGCNGNVNMVCAISTPVRSAAKPLHLVAFKRLAAALHFALALTYVFTASAGPAYRVIGQVTEVSFKKDATVRNRIQTGFVLEVKDPSWKIRTTFDSTTNYYEEYMFDGQDTYGLLVDPKVDSNSTLPASAAHTYQPVQAFCTTRLAWLALASHTHFGRQVKLRERLLTPWGTEASAGAWAYDYAVELSPHLPFLPLKATLSWSGMNWTNECAEKHIDPSTAPYQSGESLGEFSVLESTNINGLELPIRFSLNRYTKESPKSAPYILEHFDGQVTAVELLTQAPTRPVFKKPVFVLDSRTVPTEQKYLAVQYSITNNAWLERDDPRLVGLLQQAQKGYAAKLEGQFPQSKPNNASGQLIVMRVVILSLVIGGAIFLLTSARRQERGSPDSTAES
jgi:hypothetical protein